MLHDPSKAKSSYAKIHEPKTLFTRDSYYQYLEGQLNKMALFMVQSTKDGERISHLTELLEKHEERLLRVEGSMKSLAIYSHEIASQEMRGNPSEDRIDHLERKLRRVQQHMLNYTTKATSTNRRQQESQQSCQTDARYEHLERELSRLKKDMGNGSHHRSSSKISAGSSMGKMEKHRKEQLENPVFGGSHLQSQKTEKLVDRHLDEQQVMLVQKRQMEEIAFSTCTQIIRDELKDVVLRPQIKQLETKMRDYFTSKFESISQIISRVEFGKDNEYLRSANHQRLQGKLQTTKVGDTTQSSLKRRTEDRTAHDHENHKRQKTVDPFPSIDESEPQRLSFTLKGGLFNSGGLSFEDDGRAAKVQFSERNMKKKKILKVKEQSKKRKSKSKSKISHSKSHSRSVSRSASRSISKSVSRSALKSADSRRSKSRSKNINDRISSVSSVSRKHSHSRSLSKSQSQTKQPKPKSNRIPEDMTNRHRYPSHVPPKKKPSKKLSIHAPKLDDKKRN